MDGPADIPGPERHQTSPQ